MLLPTWCCCQGRTGPWLDSKGNNYWGELLLKGHCYRDGVQPPVSYDCSTGKKLKETCFHLIMCWPVSLQGMKTKAYQAKHKFVLTQLHKKYYHDGRSRSSGSQQLNIPDSNFHSCFLPIQHWLFPSILSQDPLVDSDSCFVQQLARYSLISIASQCQVTGWKFSFCVSSFPYSVFLRQGTYSKTNICTSWIVLYFKFVIQHRLATIFCNLQGCFEIIDEYFSWILYSWESIDSEEDNEQVEAIAWLIPEGCQKRL